MDDETRKQMLAAKRAIMSGKVVCYNGGEYIPVELTTRYKNGEWIYGVTLIDAGQPKSVLHAGLEKVDWQEQKEAEQDGQSGV